MLVNVAASALSTLVKSQAAGRHYSSKAVFPFVAGVDGVGRLADGRRVYINRAGKNLPAQRRQTLERAKDELRSIFGRERKTR